MRSLRLKAQSSSGQLTARDATRDSWKCEDARRTKVGRERSPTMLTSMKWVRFRDLRRSFEMGPPGPSRANMRQHCISLRRPGHRGTYLKRNMLPSGSLSGTIARAEQRSR